MFEVLLHMAADSMTLDAVIAILSAQANLDGRGSEILAAAITLRDLTARGCKHSLRDMAEFGLCSTQHT